MILWSTYSQVSPSLICVRLSHVAILLSDRRRGREQWVPESTSIQSPPNLKTSKLTIHLTAQSSHATQTQTSSIETQVKHIFQPFRNLEACLLVACAKIFFNVPPLIATPLTVMLQHLASAKMRFRKVSTTYALFNASSVCFNPSILHSLNVWDTTAGDPKTNKYSIMQGLQRILYLNCFNSDW